MKRKIDNDRNVNTIGFNGEYTQEIGKKLFEWTIILTFERQNNNHSVGMSQLCTK